MFRITLIASILFSPFFALGQDSKAEKEQLLYSLYIAHKQLIASNNYSFVAAMAYLQKGGQVDLNSSSNYLKVFGNKAAADMPYFGRATNAGYGATETGVFFDSEMMNYMVQEIDKKKKIIVSFDVKHDTETYSCTLTISGKNYASLVVSSSYKQSIRYSGGIGPLEK